MLDAETIKNILNAIAIECWIIETIANSIQTHNAWLPRINKTAPTIKAVSPNARIQNPYENT